MHKGPEQGWKHGRATEEGIRWHWLGRQGWRKEDSALNLFFLSYSKDEREVSCFCINTWRKNALCYPKLNNHPTACAELPPQCLPCCRFKQHSETSVSSKVTHHPHPLHLNNNANYYRRRWRVRRHQLYRYPSCCRYGSAYGGEHISAP